MVRRVLLAAVWLALLVVAWAVVVARGADPADAAGALADLAAGPWLVPALLAAYALRAVTFLPATALALLAGWALGPVAGALVAFVGVLGSAAIAYGLARALRRPRTHGAAAVVATPTRGERSGEGRWRARLRRNAFEAILLARLAAAPGDAVNVAAGAARAPLGAFLAATALGGAPGLLAVVWAGASLEGAFRVERVAIRPELVVASAAMAVLAVGASWWLRRGGRAAPAVRGGDDASPD